MALLLPTRTLEGGDCALFRPALARGGDSTVEGRADNDGCSSDDDGNDDDDNNDDDNTAMYGGEGGDAAAITVDATDIFAGTDDMHD